jgi:outer membrane protein assembly factor BamB
MTDFVVLPGGNIITAGYAMGNFCLVKHKSNGDIISTKMFAANAFGSLTKIKWENSSTLFVIGSNGQDLYKIDTSINILMTKQLLNGENLPSRAQDIECLPGGDKIILYHEGNSSKWIARFSSDLSTVKWSKLITGNEYSTSIIYKNLFVDGEKIFVTGGASEFYTFYYAGSIVQLNASNGNIENSKRFKLDFPELSETPAILSKMIKYDNGYIIKARFWRSNMIPATDVFGYVRIDTALNIISLKSLTKY